MFTHIGRSEKNPAEFWYKGEIGTSPSNLTLPIIFAMHDPNHWDPSSLLLAGFFDFYIIPLAKKLKDCGVFGVSSGEYLQYAEQNRREWESRGQEVVEEMLSKVERI